jgi:hypothetical protein
MEKEKNIHRDRGLQPKTKTPPHPTPHGGTCYKSNYHMIIVVLTSTTRKLNFDAPYEKRLTGNLKAPIVHDGRLKASRKTFN